MSYPFRSLVNGTIREQRSAVKVFFKKNYKSSAKKCSAAVRIYAITLAIRETKEGEDIELFTTLVLKVL